LETSESRNASTRFTGSRRESKPTGPSAGLLQEASAILSQSTHVFSEILLHINWHTEKNKPLITPTLKPEIYPFIENYCHKCKGVDFLALGGTEDHVHLVVQVEPQLCVSELIGKFKGASSHEANHRFGQGTLEWQRGFAVVSFAKRNLGAVLQYVAKQREHHKKSSLNNTLERYRAQDRPEENSSEG